MKICVIGTGTMGSGIVLAFAQAGFNVVMKGISEGELLIGHKSIHNNLSKLVEKGKMESAVMNEIISRITETITYDAFTDADLVIEAVLEDMKLKHEIFKTLDSICKPEAILASNTSSLSITEIASSTKRADKVIGMHFFNPAPVMKLVEVIKGQLTSSEVADTIAELARQMGKTPVSVNEAPGFVVNRILIPLVNEGIGIFAEGVASRDEIDEAMKLGANHPMGPLALGDLIGLDVCLAIMEVLYTEFGDSKYRPHPLLRKMVRAKQLGRKTGIGFYDYRK
jgi:3-hydroxybutyryl-CoA dehydrogenase